MKKQTSLIRENLITISKKIFRNERIRKKIIVKLYNFQTLRYFKPDRINNSIFEPEDLIKYKFFLCKENYKGNFFYGIADKLKEYANYKYKINACIEHGVYFGNYVNALEILNSGFPAVITFSNNRKEHIRRVSNKMVFAIGPYIYYARGILTQDEVKKIRSEFGKTLLVFPSHSVDKVETKFNYDDLIGEVTEFKKSHDFDTVFICLYYRDIELGRAEVYQRHGFKVVSAGRREDPLFLDRLRSIILLSDYSISNDVGTHIGYSVALNTPHTVINQKTMYVSDSKADLKHVTTLYLDSAIEEKKEVAKAFCKYTDKITPEQVEMCNKFWGLDMIKNPSEMNFILDYCQDVYLKAKKKEKKFYEIACSSATNLSDKYFDITNGALN